MSNNELKIQHEYEDNTYKTISIEGLSVSEMDEILSNHDALGDIMTAHGYGKMYAVWHNGYGIYGISHVGGHLFVRIGKSCD